MNAKGLVGSGGANGAGTDADGTLPNDPIPEIQSYIHFRVASKMQPQMNRYSRPGGDVTKINRNWAKIVSTLR